MTDTYLHGGWAGRMLWVDLENSQLQIEPLPEQLATQYIGGPGMAARLLYDLNPPSIPAAAPDAPLIFSVGPLVGERFPAAVRMNVSGRSPLTGIYADSSSGSRFPQVLKWAGFDIIVIRGRAKEPALLVIDQNQPPYLTSAADLWGTDVFEADRRLLERFGECETARIGRAGENGVLYANIIAGRRRIGVHGRMGMGALMGSKNLKAIVVKAKPLSRSRHGEELKGFASSIFDLMRKSPTLDPLRHYGTLYVASAASASMGGLYLSRNCREFLTLDQIDLIDPELFATRYKTGQTGCPGCPSPCTMPWAIKTGSQGEREDIRGNKFEFGQWASLGPNLGLLDLEPILQLSHRCDHLGIDSHEFGHVASLVMECMERGIISEKDIDGLQLRWGNAKAVFQLMDMVANQKGFGILAGKGARWLSEAIPGAEKYAIHIKGASMDVILNLPWSLSFCTSTRGGDHLKAMPFFALSLDQTGPRKLWGDEAIKVTDARSPFGSGRLVWWQENFKTLIDCLGLCIHPVQGLAVLGEHMLFQDLARCYSLLTGIEVSAEGLMTIAERCYQLERAYNARLGLGRKADGFNRRDVKNDPLCQPPPELADLYPPHPHLDVDLDQPGMLDEYYQYRGLSQGGFPTYKRLLESGLADIIADLQNYQAVVDSPVLPLANIVNHQP
ncbi:MAG: aldehyde ferredoxin oxidoreductase family protein [bacterium]